MMKEVLLFYFIEWKLESNDTNNKYININAETYVVSNPQNIETTFYKILLEIRTTQSKQTASNFRLSTVFSTFARGRPLLTVLKGEE